VRDVCVVKRLWRWLQLLTRYRVISNISSSSSTSAVRTSLHVLSVITRSLCARWRQHEPCRPRDICVVATAKLWRPTSAARCTTSPAPTPPSVRTRGPISWKIVEKSSSCRKSFVRKCKNLKQKSQILGKFKGKVEIWTAIILFSVENLQLVVGNSQLPVLLTFSKPPRRWDGIQALCSAVDDEVEYSLDCNYKWLKSYNTENITAITNSRIHTGKLR